MAVVKFCTTHKIQYDVRCPYCRTDHPVGFGLEPIRQEGTPIGPDDPKHWTGPRPALRVFADQMEYKLRKNDHKTGWHDLPVEALFRLLMIEIEEFKVAHEFFDAKAAQSELVDIANFCMMLADRLGMEKDAK